MANLKPSTRIARPPLMDGQVWCMEGLNLQVGMVGKLLVHYKLAKPNAVRIPNLVGSIVSVEKYLRQHKAVLESPPAAVEAVAAGKPAKSGAATASPKRRTQA